MSHAPGFLKMVNNAKKNVRELTVADVARMQDAKEKFTLVDCREDLEWKAGHIPGALHIGKGVMERDIEAKIPDQSTKIVIYCGGGFRSALAADAIQQMGYRDVYSMDGGIRGWREARLPEKKPD
ncbi:MAG: rhodanese-like domain-containing protein [Bacteriovoracia bacterium]